jgi:hypothetical protein
LRSEEYALSEQDVTKSNIHQLRPTNRAEDTRRAYWKAQGQPWRTEQITSEERKQFLSDRRKIKPNWLQGIHPFKDIKLSRADVEWLLATHENGRGPIDWDDEKQRERNGLDLRKANLRNENLSELPLSKCVLEESQLQSADLGRAQHNYKGQTCEKQNYRELP